MANTILQANPLKEFLSYRVYYTIKIGRRLKDDGNGRILGYNDPKTFLLLDTRGNVSGDRKNDHPKLTVQYFDLSHYFSDSGSGIDLTFATDATLKIYERGGASYLHRLGKIMADLKITQVPDIVFWIGVGIIGWVSSDKKIHQKPIVEKWFPMHIKHIGMNMRNSGSEYTHELVGWDTARNKTKSTQHSTINITKGNTLVEHLNDLMQKVNNKIEDIKSEININSGAQIQPKRIIYSYTLDPSINKDAPIEVNSRSQGTKGIKQVSSGGTNGITTISSQILEILKRCPTVVEDLNSKSSQFKIHARPISMNESEEKIDYRITAYRMAPDDKTIPLRRYNYFFGGRNEDILEFDFTLDGSFNILPHLIQDSTLEDAHADPDRTVQQQEVNSNNAKQNLTNENIRGSTANKSSERTDNNQLDVRGKVEPIQSMRDYFNTDLTRPSSEAWLKMTHNLQASLGKKLVDNVLKIIGDPNLILDSETKKRLGMEDGVNYIIFNVGIPSTEFPNVPAPENLIFSGKYMIRGIKSIFDSSGKFTQELQLTHLNDL